MSKKSATKKIVSDKEFGDYVAKRAELFQGIKDRNHVTNTLDMFKSDNLPNPFDVVREFIKEKGLKLYGGQAIHEHLKRRKLPIYSEYEFPDYDVFSPDAKNHAKELADRLYNLGFYFVEAKASIINDNKHQTYKVSVDLIYVLDLTQIGCNQDQLKNNQCKECGKIGNECYSLFNNIPAIDILSKKDMYEYDETYDYGTEAAVYPDKMFVCSPDWLKTSMYLETSQPFNDPSRLEKVSQRLELFENEFQYDQAKCQLLVPLQQPLNPKHPKLLKQILNVVDEYIKSSKIIHYGSSAYNFYVSTKSKQLDVIDYEVYTNENPGEYYEELMPLLEKRFRDANFKLVEKILYWKDIDSENYTIMFNKNGSKYLPLITFTKANECMPYVQYRGVRYATIDRLKYNYFRAVSLHKILYKSEIAPKNYGCLLQNLLDAENAQKIKKGSRILKGKFERFRKECIGDEVGKLMDNLYTFFGENVKFTNASKQYIDTPKKGLITKIYPLEQDTNKFNYRPAERKRKYYNRTIKITDPSQRKKKSNKNKPERKRKSSRKKKHGFLDRLW